MEKVAQTTHGRGKNKRYWSNKELDTLLDLMVDFKDDPQWRCEGGFKAGFTSALEKKLTEKFPSAGIKANPHIESKVKWLKEKYAIITEMLRLSGFKWDDETNKVQCEKQAYDEFCEGRPKARGIYGLEFPYMPKLDIIFGVDRARGTEVEDIDDAIDGLERSAINLGTDEGDNENMSNFSNAPPSKKLKVRRTLKGSSSKGDLTDKWTNTMNNMNEHLDKIASSMVAAEEREQAAYARDIEIKEQKTSLLAEIGMIEGLSMDDVIDAARILSNNPNELDIFYSCPNNEWKRNYVLKLIR